MRTTEKVYNALTLSTDPNTAFIYLDGVTGVNGSQVIYTFVENKTSKIKISLKKIKQI